MNSDFDKLKKILIGNFGISEADITPKSDLAGDFNLSDMEVNDLVSQISRDFELKIPNNADPISIKTVDDLLNMIDSYSENI